MSSGHDQSAGSGEEASALLRQRGNEAFKRREYETAVELYGRALEAVCEDEAGRAALLSNRAMACYKLGSYAQAAADAEACLAIDPANAKARYRAALAHLMQGQPAAAQPFVAALLEAAQQQPEQQEQEQGGGAAATEPCALPPFLSALRDAAAAQLAHHDCKSRLASQGPEAWRAEAQRVQQLLQALSDDMEGEGDADIGAVLAELAPLLTGSAEARAAFELRPGYPLALYCFTEAYSPLAAAVLQAASGRQSAPQPAPAPEEAALGEQGGTVLWPAAVWQRLLTTALAGSSAPLAAAAMQLLAWAAGDPWARCQVLAHPFPGGAGSGGQRCPAEQVATALQQLSQSGLQPAAVTAAVELLGRFGEDALSAEALAQLRLRPLATLLHLFQEAEPLLEAAAAPAVPAEAQGQGSAAEVQGGAANSHLAREQEALEELRHKQRAVYDVRVVALRRAVLRALCSLCSRADLVAAELAPTAAAKGGKGKGQKSGGSGQPEGFLAELVRLARALHEQSPKRSAPVLGPDGRPKAFSKRPFAADFKDNPAGDFLAGLELEGATPGETVDLFRRPSGSGASASAGAGAAQRPAAGAEATLLELALSALLRVARSGPAAAVGLLFRLDALGLCEALWQYTTPAVVELGQRLCVVLAERHPAAFSELLQDGSVLGLASLLQHIPLPAQHAGAEQPPAGAGAGPAAAAAGQPAGGSAEASLRLLFQAVEKLGALVDTCSGDEFAHLTQSPGGALLRAFRIAHGQPPAAEGPEAGGAAAATAKLRRSAARFVMLCCDRAQRQQGLQRWQPPRGGAWAAIGAPALQAVLAPREPAPARKDEAPAGGTASPGKENGAGAGQQEETGTDGEGLAKLRKGFLAAAGRGKPKGLQRGAGQAAGAAALHPSQPPVASPAAVAGAAGGRPRVIIEDITDLDQGNPSASAGSGGGEGAAPPSAEEAARLAAAVQREAWEAQQAQQAWLAYQAAEAEKEAAAEAEGAEEELRDVYDSTPSLAVRQARNAWMAVPLEQKLRWDQTSTDVNTWIVMPPGTRARDVKVTILPDWLTVELKWYGRVADGPLHRRAKASEAQWCMEDNEVHVILPKDDRSYWKALFEGGEEKGYVELLKEAVHADEPATPYDEMDDHAKALLDEMLDRQAMINEGLIDPEGFDDFRVVVGENSLVQR